ALERILADRAQLGVAAIEQGPEDVAEVPLNLGERLDEELAGGGVDLLDRLEELRLGRQQIRALPGEELEALFPLLILLDRDQVDRSERSEPVASGGELGLGHHRVEALGHGFRLPALDLHLVLGPQSLERALELGVRLELPDLDLMQE